MQPSNRAHGEADHLLTAQQTYGLVTHRRQPAADLIGEALAELQRPLPHGLMADHDAARGEQFVHHAQAEREAEVQPYGVADDLGREPVASVAGAGG